MNRLGVERAKDKELFAVIELGDDHCAHCFADGIQMVTGCTFGKGNIRKTGYGKFGVTLVDRSSGHAVRVVPKAEAQARMKETPFFKEYRMQGVPPSRVHHMNLWSLCSHIPVLTAHVEISPSCEARRREVLDEVCSTLRSRYRVGHVTLTPEAAPAGNLCALVGFI